MRAIKQTCGPGLEELNLNRNSDHLRIYFDAELKNLSTAGLADMLIVCTNLVSLDLGSCPIDGCEDAFLNMIHMQDLRLNMCGLNDTLIKAIGKGMPDLRILKARDHDVRDLTPLAESKAPIREIEFTRSWSCSEESFAKFFKADVALKASGETVSQAFLGRNPEFLIRVSLFTRGGQNATPR
eukprot:m.182681 g.182681  ORF g.182681 m.182681 type:complete len:183 (-) comp15534_c0_seq5:1055-1603(-)